MKGCSLGMLLRCMRATRAKARDICSTLPARGVDLRRFTRAVGRMYLLTPNALRVLHRTKTGTWRRRATMCPSGRHGRAISSSSVPSFALCKTVPSCSLQDAKMCTLRPSTCDASEKACFFFCTVRSSGASELSCAHFAVGETAASESSLAVDIDGDEVRHLDAHTRLLLCNVCMNHTHGV